jgi:hypothetical protein
MPPVLNRALELGARSWTLAFTVGLGQKPRLKPTTACTTPGLLWRIVSEAPRGSRCPSAFFGQAHDELQRLDMPSGVARQPVLLPQGPLADCEDLLGWSDRLVKLPRAAEPVKRLLQLQDALDILAAGFLRRCRLG